MSEFVITAALATDYVVNMSWPGGKLVRPPRALAAAAAVAATATTTTTTTTKTTATHYYYDDNGLTGWRFSRGNLLSGCFLNLFGNPKPHIHIQATSCLDGGNRALEIGFLSRPLRGP